MNINHWDDYASCFLEDFEDSEEHRNLVSLVKDKQIAAIIKYHFRINYRAWLDQKIDALDGRTPNQCFTTKDGVNDLKEMLMQIS